MNDRIIHCSICDKIMGVNELESVWEPNDDKTYELIHPCPPNPTFDGLKIAWKRYNYVNPPFNKKVRWIDKALEEQALGNTTAMLLPHDTRAIWYADKILPNCEVLMFRGNFDLDNGKHTRYGMILAIFNPVNALEKSS